MYIKSFKSKEAIKSSISSCSFSFTSDVILFGFSIGLGIYFIKFRL